MPTGSVSIPSFSNSGDASSPGHSPADPRRRRPGVTVFGTSRSGGALNTYGALPGSRVYTVYIDTDAGTAVLQYSSADSSGREFAQDLIAPEAVRAEVPADLRSTKFIVSCVVDRSGLLRNMRVLQNSAPDTVTRVLAMLHAWRFRLCFAATPPSRSTPSSALTSIPANAMGRGRPRPRIRAPRIFTTPKSRSVLLPGHGNFPCLLSKSS